MRKNTVVACVGAVVIAVWLGVTIWVIARDRDGRMEPLAASSNESIIPAETLLAQYMDDKVKATGRYGGKTIRVRLRIDKIEVGGNTITIAQQEGSDWLPPSVSCWVKGSESSRIAKGKTVVVRGSVTSYIDVKGSEHLSLANVTLE